VIGLPDVDEGSLSRVLEYIYTGLYPRFGLSIHFLGEIYPTAVEDSVSTRYGRSTFEGTLEMTAPAPVREWRLFNEENLPPDVNAYLCAVRLGVHSLVQLSRVRVKTAISLLLSSTQSAEFVAERALSLLLNKTESGKDALRQDALSICVLNYAICEATPALKALLLQHEPSLWSIVPIFLTASTVERPFKCSSCSRRLLDHDICWFRVSATKVSSLQCLLCEQGDMAVEVELPSTPQSTPSEVSHGDASDAARASTPELANSRGSDTDSTCLSNSVSSNVASRDLPELFSTVEVGLEKLAIHSSGQKNALPHASTLRDSVVTPSSTASDDSHSTTARERVVAGEGSKHDVRSEGSGPALSANLPSGRTGNKAGRKPVTPVKGKSSVGLHAALDKRYRRSNTALLPDPHAPLTRLLAFQPRLEKDGIFQISSVIYQSIPFMSYYSQ
jgi:hypothetical protein